MNKKNLIFWFLGFGALLGFGMILIREGFNLISESYALSSSMDSHLVLELLDDLIAGVLILALTVLFGVFAERKIGRLFFCFSLKRDRFAGPDRVCSRHLEIWGPKPIISMSVSASTSPS